MRIPDRRWTVLPLVLALALGGCGGGGSSSTSSGTGSGTGSGSGSGNTSGSTSSPSSPVWTARIEPFDPSAAASAVKAAPAPSVAHGLVDPADARVITLEPLATLVTKSVAAAVVPGVPYRIGEPRGVAETVSAAKTTAQLQWRPGPGGTQLAALRFESPGAHGVRLGVLVKALPAGAVLRFYGAAQDEAVEVSAQDLQAVAERNARGGAGDTVARTYWSPDFAGTQTTLEVQIPAGATPDSVQLAVPGLSHFTLSPAEAQDAVAATVAKAGSCPIDVSCNPDYLNQSRSVARMTFVEQDGASYYCSGTLMNDAASSGTPFFLSANHCISSQAVASTLVTDWFYRTASCGSTSVNPGVKRLTGGAVLLYASAVTDTSFMQLSRAAPAGIVYAGSYYGGVPVGTTLVDLQHPQGGLQTISQGTLLRYGNCSSGSCGASDSDNGAFMALSWQQGSTAAGSSGSPAFVTIGTQRYVTGQLYGGTASCATPTGLDYFGRFDLSYRAALQQWLNPGATN